MSEKRVLKSARILIEHHPNNVYVGIAYLMWSPPVVNGVGYPTFIEVSDKDSELDCLCALDVALVEYGFRLFSTEFSVEHSLVKEEDLQIVKIVNNG